MEPSRTWRDLQILEGAPAAVDTDALALPIFEMMMPESWPASTLRLAAR